MDQFDRATELEELHRESALVAQLGKMPHGESAHECEDCGEPIPEARRAAIHGVTRCVDCQGLIEQNNKYGMWGL